MPALRAKEKVDNEKSADYLGEVPGLLAVRKKAYPALAEVEGFHLEALAISVEIKKRQQLLVPLNQSKKTVHPQHQCLGHHQVVLENQKVPGKADASKDKGGFSFGQGAPVEDTNDVAKSNMFGSASTKARRRK